MKIIGLLSTLVFILGAAETDKGMLREKEARQKKALLQESQPLKQKKESRMEEKKKSYPRGTIATH